MSDDLIAKEAANIIESAFASLRSGTFKVRPRGHGAGAVFALGQPLARPRASPRPLRTRDQKL